MTLDQSPTSESPAWRNIFPAFWRGYTQAMGFTGRKYTGEDDEDRDQDTPLFDDPGLRGANFDDYVNVEDEVFHLLSPEDRQELVDDCEGFLSSCEEQGLLSVVGASDKRAEQAGTDFHFTRNGHGAGFWDGSWPDEEGEALTALSKPYGSCELEGKEVDGEIVELWLIH